MLFSFFFFLYIRNLTHSEFGELENFLHRHQHGDRLVSRHRFGHNVRIYFPKSFVNPQDFFPCEKCTVLGVIRSPVGILSERPPDGRTGTHLVILELIFGEGDQFVSHCSVNAFTRLDNETINVCVGGDVQLRSKWVGS